MPNIQDQVRRLVDDFAEKLSALVQQAAVESAVNALQGEVSSPVFGRSRRARGKSTAPGRNARRDKSQIEKTLSRVVAYVEANPVSRSEDIKKGLRLSAAQTGDALTRLVESKTLKRKGQRRASTYTKS